MANINTIRVTSMNARLFDEFETAVALVQGGLADIGDEITVNGKRVEIAKFGDRGSEDYFDVLTRRSAGR